METTTLAVTMLAGLLSLGGLASYLRRAKPKGSPPTSTKFFGSQLGGKAVINYSYTDLPWILLGYDIYYFIYFVWALPYILFPISPTDSGDLAELAWTGRNFFCILVHSLLCVMQLAFMVSLPLMILLPIWMAALAIGLFLLVNYSLCLLLNGNQVEYWSDPEYAPALPEHAHEQWIFINGVAVGEHWMKSNLNRLAATFKRPVLGIHNKTEGILFDVLECLIQRNFGYATTDVRVCYKRIKETLYNPQFSKVVFILHSQGGIEGSLIIDWLLQELPQDLLAKLEVYTFGNAANHFNNPHRHLFSQISAGRNPLAGSTDSTLAAPNGVSTDAAARGNPVPGEGADRVLSVDTQISSSPAPSLTTETSSSNPSAISDRAIGHIEHYAHTTDFVALWGVLHFATSANETKSMPRFLGRVFSRTTPRGGHQFCQHYLDGMFPLARDPATGQLARDPGTGALLGCAEDGNEFMESEIVIGHLGDEINNAREAMEISWLGSGFDRDAELTRLREVEVHFGSSPVARRGRWRSRADAQTGGRRAAKLKVKELSRLWKYRNGKSPQEKPPLLHRDADGVVRNATM
ncbi:hypothetical protein GQ53DRAFT_243767 [Thozetella sp. PMI_491]|nr:hypothetical protein GQ53DRAFT_243767 [Thozetella sp. PMI_491]